MSTSVDLDVGELPATVATVFHEGARGWRPFLLEFSPFILGCVRRLSSDHDERMEIYAHVCERLWADDCRRIKQFRGRGDSGSCKFTTWLAAVTLNLGREWVRRTRGRRRVFRPIQKLDSVTQAVFRLHYWDGYTAAEISEVLGDRSPGSVERVEAALARIRASLTKDHRWRLVRLRFRHASPVSIDSGGLDGGTATPICGRSQRIDDVASERDAIAVLRQAIESLDDPQRRALELRYRNGMSAREIAAEMGIANYKRVYEMQAKGIDRLRRALVMAGVELVDFERMKTEFIQ